ncbi:MULTISPECIES: SIR2 family protein [unclassified Mesorhizobium]|uniref:SIR2 family NAD-dependent protein deacylase n=1 Tax=unclassified Mesorhizobium TaxID=325217 RepID=UPI0003CF4FAF|nr:SIR2 family protein [Mesorhizobium sp. LSHC420B00]ESX78745.1 transcriptional regulator [Mesorhizobium sp. LSHC420B00]
MNTIPTSGHLVIVRDSFAEKLLDLAKQALAADEVIPYLGPGLLGFNCAEPPVPHTPEVVAAALNARAPAPSKIRTNMWSVAQFIEQRRHRRTLQAWMTDIFAAPVAPTVLHAWLARLPLSLIVDSWYDSAMRTALVETGRTDVVEIQGVTRANEIRDIWTKTYDLSGRELDPRSGAKTVLYTPHGSIRPAQNFLVADSDYVEVLTEIDIQTPIPDVVKERRITRGFFFVGCRFNGQMLRTYARQIMKRSRGPHCAVMDAETLTRNEARFLAASGITVIDMPVSETAARLIGTGTAAGGGQD